MAKEEIYRNTIRSLTIKVQTLNSIIQEIRVEPFHRPVAHIHDPDHPRPVLVFDFNGTLTPFKGFPLEGEEAIPFPGVIKYLNKWKAQQCCLHVATAGLWPQVKADPLTYAARMAQLGNWFTCYGAPIDYVLPKADCDIFYDDRMIPVPHKTKDVDWDEIADRAEEDLSKRFSLKDGAWERKPKKRIGHEIQDDEWLNYDEVPPDNPRGYSTPIIDVDFHRTLSQASSSLRRSGFRPGAVEGCGAIYDAGYTIYLSCAGWNPATHTLEDSERRIAMMRRDAKVEGVKYDQFVTKDHGDLYFDDKGFRHIDWATDLPQLMDRLFERSFFGHSASGDGKSDIDEFKLKGTVEPDQAGTPPDKPLAKPKPGGDTESDVSEGQRSAYGR